MFCHKASDGVVSGASAARFCRMAGDALLGPDPNPDLRGLAR